MVTHRPWRSPVGRMAWFGHDALLGLLGLKKVMEGGGVLQATRWVCNDILLQIDG